MYCKYTPVSARRPRPAAARSRRIFSQALIPPLLLLVPLATQAQSADPTRPAIDILSAAAPGVSEVQAPGGLQSIIRRQGGKPAALIDGVLVELGGKVGEARLVRIGEDFVVLRGSMGSETLRLTPGIEKKTANAASPTSGHPRSMEREGSRSAREAFHVKQVKK